MTVSWESNKEMKTLPLQHRCREGKGPTPLALPVTSALSTVRCPHAYPGREVHCGTAVEEQGGHVDIPVVGGDVQRGEAALQEAKRHIGKTSLPQA